MKLRLSCHYWISTTFCSNATKFHSCLNGKARKNAIFHEKNGVAIAELKPLQFWGRNCSQKTRLFSGISKFLVFAFEQCQIQDQGCKVHKIYVNYSLDRIWKLLIYHSTLLVKVLRWGKKKCPFWTRHDKGHMAFEIHFRVDSYCKILQLIELGECSS